MSHNWGFNRVSIDTYARCRDNVMFNHKYKNFITLFTEQELHNMNAACYLSSSEQTGFAITDASEVIGLFSTEGKARGAVVYASICGGTQLFCLGEYLRALYESCGFVVVQEDEWDDSLAPSDWDYASHGRCNAYVMRYVGYSVAESTSPAAYRQRMNSPW